MLSDLTSIDLLTLAVATDWSAEHKKGLSDQYTQALAAHIEEKFRNHLSPEQIEMLDTLAENPKSTDAMLIKFYQKYIPDMPAFLEQVSLNFKKEFLINLYDRYCTEFVTETNKLKEEFEKTKDEDIQKMIVQKTKAQLHWEHVLKLAKDDEWNEVARLLQPTITN